MQCEHSTNNPLETEQKSIASKVLVCLQAECQIMSQLMHKRFVSDFLGLLFFITTGTTRAVPIICFGSK